MPSFTFAKDFLVDAAFYKWWLKHHLKIVYCCSSFWRGKVLQHLWPFYDLISFFKCCPLLSISISYHYIQLLKTSCCSEAKLVKIINHLYKLLESFFIHYSGGPLLFSMFKAKLETTMFQEMKTEVISLNIQFICILSTILLPASAQESLFPWCHFFPPNKWMYWQ